MPENNKKNVSWTVFVWVVGITTFLIAGAYSFAYAANVVAQNNRVEIKGIQSTIISEFSNIKQSLNRIENKVE